MLKLSLSRVLALMGIAGMGGCTREGAPRSARVPSVQTAPLKSEADIRELDIAFYTDRVAQDPTGAFYLARLGSAYLARARETGDPRDAIKAENVARRSIRNRAARNGAAPQVLESALLAQHRFAEALSLAVAARDAEPDNAALRAAVGEIQMELGQYDSARVAFANLHTTSNDLTVVPRLARWAEIEGNPERARRLLHGTLVAALGSPTMPKEQLAWFWLRVGDVELRTGHMRSADSAYAAGLAAHPGDYRLLSALSRSALQQHKFRGAVEYGEQAIAVALDPATLGTLSDAYAALGDTSTSNHYAHVLDVAVLNQPGEYHRAWSLFLLDHGRHVGTVARKIRTEMKTRQDVYAYDLLAWSLHREGRDVDAERAMTRALREGTQDAQLFYHSGMIERSLGHTDLARTQLTRALGINPMFHATQPGVARAALASLTTGGAVQVVTGSGAAPGR